MTPALAIFSGIGPWEIALILVVALLIFGRRLPEVGRSLGKGIVEFKKGLQGIEDEIDDAVNKSEKKSDDVPRNEPRSLDDHRDREADFDEQREKENTSA